jgi:hypothetical protein
MFHDKNCRSCLLLVLLVISAAAAIAADPTGTISGLVTDPSGAAVVNADVTVRNPKTGLTRSAKTDTQGGFLFPLMPVGTYDVTIEMQGFRRFEQKGITLLVNGVAQIPVALQIGALAESVTVEADATLVETRSGTIKGVVDQQRIVELPLNGRNAATLINLAAGTISTTAGNARGSGDAIQGGTYPGAQAISANGGRSDGVNYLLDGGSNRDPYTNVNDPFPNPDALQEFVVQTNNYGAEYGRASGAIVSVVTKSGTNELHGSAFEFLRNEDLNARNFFSPSADILKRHQFGGSVGGPVVKDKVFYFGTIQATTLRSLPASLNSVVPTAAQRTGDFSAITRQLKDPATGQNFPNNQIPMSLFAPAAVKLLDSIPVPTNPQGVIFYTRPDTEHEVQFMGRADYNTARNRLYGRYFISDLPIAPTAIKSNLVAAANGKAYRAQSVSGSDTYTFSPNVINNATFTFSRTHGGVVSAAPFAWADVGVPIAHTDPAELVLSVSGFFSINTGHPGLFARQSYNFSDTVHYIRGGHDLAMGFDYLKMNIDLINTFRQNGNFRFRGTSFTGNALSDFFLGYVDRFIQGGGEYAARRGTLASGFVQDNWKLSRKLTVNLGLRYDPFVPFSDERGFTECFRPGLKSARYPNAPVGYIYAGDAGCPAGGTQSRWLQFAPRIGFSYDVTGKAKTVVRGGYGLFYQPPFVESFNNMVDSAPFSPQFIRFSVPFMNPFRGITNPFPAQFGPRVPPSDTAFDLPVTGVSYSGDWTPAQTQSWNIAVEHQVRSDTLVRLAYVGSKGTHLGYNTDRNAPPFGPGASVDNIDARRPFQNFATIIEDEAGATSIYNSFQATIEKRFSKGLSLLANYTWSKSIDTASFQTDLCGINIINPFNIGAYRGLSDYDSTHKFVLSYLWQMPSLKNASPLVRTTLGGWESSGIWNWQSGFPLTVTSGDERSATGIGLDNADLGGDPRLDPDRPRKDLIARYFNTSVFALAKLGTFGNTGRGILRGPGTFNVDWSAMKNFHITERFRLQYRAEFFNLFNTPQFNNPNTSFTDSRFGQITGARAPRIIQMALKMYW